MVRLMNGLTASESSNTDLREHLCDSTKQIVSACNWQAHPTTSQLDQRRQVDCQRGGNAKGCRCVLDPCAVRQQCVQTLLDLHRVLRPGIMV